MVGLVPTAQAPALAGRWDPRNKPEDDTAIFVESRARRKLWPTHRRRRRIRPLSRCRASASSTCRASSPAPSARRSWPSSAPRSSRSSCPRSAMPLRKFGTITKGGDSLLWLQECRNKKSATLDLRKPEGAEILKRLVVAGRRAGRELPARHHGKMGPRLGGPASRQNPSW